MRGSLVKRKKKIKETDLCFNLREPYFDPNCLFIKETLEMSSRLDSECISKAILRT